MPQEWSVHLTLARLLALVLWACPVAGWAQTAWPPYVPADVADALGRAVESRAFADPASGVATKSGSPLYWSGGQTTAARYVYGPVTTADGQVCSDSRVQTCSPACRRVDVRLLTPGFTADLAARVCSTDAAMDVWQLSRVTETRLEPAAHAPQIAQAAPAPPPAKEQAAPPSAPTPRADDARTAPLDAPSVAASDAATGSASDSSPPTSPAAPTVPAAIDDQVSRADRPIVVPDRRHEPAVTADRSFRRAGLVALAMLIACLFIALVIRATRPGAASADPAAVPADPVAVPVEDVADAHTTVAPVARPAPAMTVPEASPLAIIPPFEPTTGEDDPSARPAVPAAVARWIEMATVDSGRAARLGAAAAASATQAECLTAMIRGVSQGDYWRTSDHRAALAAMVAALDRTLKVLWPTEHDPVWPDSMHVVGGGGRVRRCLRPGLASRDGAVILRALVVSR